MADPKFDRIRGWIDTFAEDVGALQKLVAEPSAARDARLVGAAALNYLVTRLDLIPDWEETAGIIDDAMVLRVAAAMATEHDVGDLDADSLRALGKLANDADGVQAFLGADLHPRLKKYVQGLVPKIVRGRTPAAIVDDAKQRDQLYAEIKDELARLPPAPMTDPDRVARIVKNYLVEKLK
ncbi:MAG TPA: DUF1232 domain-containing protein [Haliangiales bacterium]|nr:DUF1232 domain-containing protein [Haliangiales bacterium]